MTVTGGTSKRVHITLSDAVYVELNSISAESDIKSNDAIREAITDWLEAKKRALRREGYLARAKEDLAMMDEFKQIDGETW